MFTPSSSVQLPTIPHRGIKIRGMLAWSSISAHSLKYLMCSVILTFTTAALFGYPQFPHRGMPIRGMLTWSTLSAHSLKYLMFSVLLTFTPCSSVRLPTIPPRMYANQGNVNVVLSLCPHTEVFNVFSRTYVYPEQLCSVTHDSPWR